MTKAAKRNMVLWVLILIPYLLLIPAALRYFTKIEEVENASFIIISKADLTLSEYNYQGVLLQKSKVAVGKNPGNKKNKGDMETPEGIFHIVSIENASAWVHDFKDDTLGLIKGAYGPYFIRLEVPGQKGIGIHGTHDNASLGTRASEGCIRMNNGEITQLVKKIKIGSVVIITPGADDILLSKTDSAKKANTQLQTTVAVKYKSQAPARVAKTIKNR